MPELPEVETTRRGIEPYLRAATVATVIIRESRLRWPIPKSLPRVLTGQTISTVGRRGKYLLLSTPKGVLILHLGMSGSLRIATPDTPYRKHDHFALRLDNGKELRLHDPRRFGAVLWHAGGIEQHPRLAGLGPEPLLEAFDADYLYAACRGRKVAIKQHIMNSAIVVGVGNIYANEALFLAGIDPRRAAGRISRARIARLTAAIKQVLSDAIAQGGTTLRDFVHENGEPGYFKSSLSVYGREGEPCPACGMPVRHAVLGQRATFYCARCQT